MRQDQAETIAREALGAGEELLWCGRPVQGLLWRPGSGCLLALLALMAGSGLSETATTGDWVPAALTPLVALALGAMLFTPDVRRRSHQAYAVTDRRVLFIRTGWAASVKALAMRDILDIRLAERPDGAGTIVLRPGDDTCEAAALRAVLYWPWSLDGALRGWQDPLWHWYWHGFITQWSHPLMVDATPCVFDWTPEAAMVYKLLTGAHRAATREAAYQAFLHRQEPSPPSRV